MKTVINYKIISDAIQYYVSKGFIYHDVEWVCHHEVAKMTMPKDGVPYYLENRTLVGSAEQSFLEEIVYHNLEPNRYVAASPCFRNEAIDETHSKYFFKVELIDFKNPTKSSLLEILQYCADFFEKYTAIKVVETGKDMYDIIDLHTNIELGSYGIREVEGIRWIYATGIAEPRLSYVSRI